MLTCCGWIMPVVVMVVAVAADAGAAGAVAVGAGAAGGLAGSAVGFAAACGAPSAAVRGPGSAAPARALTHKPPGARPKWRALRNTSVWTFSSPCSVVECQNRSGFFPKTHIDPAPFLSPADWVKLALPGQMGLACRFDDAGVDERSSLLAMPSACRRLQMPPAPLNTPTSHALAAPGSAPRDAAATAA